MPVGVLGIGRVIDPGMKLGWQVLFPASLFIVVATAGFIALFPGVGR
jgi:NADH:ubiquinone oxidoreductase subunit H